MNSVAGRNGSSESNDTSSPPNGQGLCTLYVSVPHFKAFLMNTMQNIDVPFGIEIVA